MKFELRVLDPQSRQVSTVTLDAATATQAQASVQGGGGVVLETRALRWQFGQAKALNVALLCRELRALLEAGLTVVEALEALSASSGPQGEHAQLLARLKQGKSLSAALADMAGMPPLLIASVKASERTSDLPHALEAYLRFDDMVSALRRKIISAALYPAVVVALGLLIGVFLLTVVVPRFARLYGDATQHVSGPTQWMLALSSTLADHPWLAPLGLAALLGLAVWLVWDGRIWPALGALLLKWPWLARQWAHFEKARLYEALALMVRGGYSLHEAMGVVRSLGGGAEAQARLMNAQTLIGQGQPVSAAFAANGLTDPLTERLIRAGERGGQFERVLSAVALRHRQAFETFVERATKVVEPLLLLGVALMVGSLVVLLYMPIFDIAGSVG